MTLNEARHEIDKIDDELICLLLKRFDLSRAIGKIKKENCIPTIDRAREEEIFNKLKVSAQNDYEYIEPIFKEILTSSKKAQSILCSFPKQKP